jgi:CobQ-like glutamine amidotransferase family enzyme
MTFRIVHLFPNELGIFGDVGNVTALEMRARWSGVDVLVETVDLSDAIPTSADVYVIGSGSTAGLRAVSTVMPALSRALNKAHADGATVVGIGAGLHLLTTRVEMAAGEAIDGVGLIDAVSVPRVERLVGPVSAFAGAQEVAGYMNTGHELVGAHTALIEKIEGLSVDGDGVSARGILGTHLHGPFFPMNPHFADGIIEKHTGVAVNQLDSRVERATHAAFESRGSLRREMGL